jgi:hypothetical protein
MEFNDGMIFETRAGSEERKQKGAGPGGRGSVRALSWMKRVEALGLWCLLGSRKGGNHEVGRVFIRQMLVTLLGYICRSLGRRLQGRKRVVHVFLISWSRTLGIRKPATLSEMLHVRYVPPALPYRCFHMFFVEVACDTVCMIFCCFKYALIHPTSCYCCAASRSNSAVLFRSGGLPSDSVVRLKPSMTPLYDTMR